MEWMNTWLLKPLSSARLWSVSWDANVLCHKIQPSWLWGKWGCGGQFLQLASSTGHLQQRSPTFLAPRTSFVEDIFSTDWQRVGGMVQSVMWAMGSDGGWKMKLLLLTRCSPPAALTGPCCPLPTISVVEGWWQMQSTQPWLDAKHLDSKPSNHIIPIKENLINQYFQCLLCACRQLWLKWTTFKSYSNPKFHCSLFQMSDSVLIKYSCFEPSTWWNMPMCRQNQKLWIISPPL